MQPLTELRVYPVDLSEFGTTPFKQSVYRVVWADSRKSVAYRGDTQFVTDKYQHGAESELRGKWVLEKWLSASAYYGMDAERWTSLQKVAPQVQRYSLDQQSEIGKFLQTLDSDMRKTVEAQLSPTPELPIIEPYSSEGEYEFAGIYFAEHVETAFLKQQLRSHIYRMAHTTDAERNVDRDVRDEAKRVEADKKFDGMFEEAIDAAHSAA